MKKNFYISTAIPYVNAKPHIGHALEYVQTDTVARYQRLLGKDVFFLSGTDENSLKNVQAAEKAGKHVREFVDEHYIHFYNFKKSLNVSFDDFIRTVEERHVLGAQKLWSMFNPDDIYKKKYRGLYCVGCEAFYTEDELVDGKCPEHKREPEVVEEENYFFKLSNYQNELKKIIKSDVVKITPDFRKNEVLAFIERGLEDFSISRSHERARGWGVEVPGDKTQIMYVWVDALSNYITALNFGGDQELYKKYWVQKESKLHLKKDDREVVHVIGKGILRFHAIYWLGMLLSAKLPLPTGEFIHGYVTVNGEKISKSLGNVIDPYEVVEKYGTDAVRYYLLGGIHSYKDGDFSYEKIEEFYTAYLSNGIGNLTSRIVTMIEKYSKGVIPEKVSQERKHRPISKFWDAYHEALGTYKFHVAVDLISALVAETDTMISEQKPWEKVKQGQDIAPLLYHLAEKLRHISLALVPFIPDTAAKIRLQLGLEPLPVEALEDIERWGVLKANTKVQKGDILFPRLA